MGFLWISLSTNYKFMIKKCRTQSVDTKLSWEETYKETAQDHEDWQDFENAISDGIETVNAQNSPVINYGLKA